MRIHTFIALSLILCITTLVHGKGYEQGPPTNGATAYLTPAEELKLLQLQDDYYLELVLSDPDIEEPVDIQFDGNGRMYVLEMRNYMNDANATNQNAGTGIVSRHEDTNGDGVYNSHSVFAKNLLLPRKIMVLNKGVVIGETQTHDLKYYEDTTGDGVADKIELFHEGGARGGNMEHQPNGFVWALDNWWYSTYNGFRYRYTGTSGGELTKTTMPGQSQWGIDQDLYGKVWYNNAGGERGPQDYQHHLLYGKSGRGNTAANWTDVWPIDNYPDTQGGHRRLREDNTLNHFTATCGQSIFSGHSLPQDLVGDLIFGEPVGRLVRRAKIIEDENGVVSLTNAYPRSEFIRTKDANFHIVNSANAPDGTLYLVDMYRGIIQQGNWTRKGSYLRGVIDAYGLGKNVDRGRIWRLRHKDHKRDKTMPRMLGMKPSKLIGYLNHPAGWWRMEAQKLIVLSGDKSVTKSLIKMAKNDSNHFGRLHALWTLEGLDAITPEIVLTAGADKHPRIREAALRLGEPFYINNTKVADLAVSLTKDPSGIVKKQAKLSMVYAQHPAAPKPPPPANKAVAGSFTKAEAGLIAKGKIVYDTLCNTCHGKDGKGYITSDKLHMGPSLAGSPRVNGHPAFSISTVLYGLEGKLDGKEYAAKLMIPMGSNDDKWVAGVLSYVRTSFGNTAATVSPQLVAEVRKRDARKKHWTQAELEKHYTPRLKNRGKWILTASNNAGSLKNAVDGNLQSRYDTKGSQRAGMWLSIEFPTKRMIGGLSLNNTGSGNDHARKLKIEVSSDGKSWTKVVEKAGTGSDINEFLFAKTLEAKHLKISLLEKVQRNFWSIHDLHVFGK